MSNGTHYEVLARKYRPQNFSELAGQEHVSRTLQNAIDSGRVAHAFLFTGARGVGKTSTARIMAKTLNCERGVTHEPCNICPQCLEITKGTSTDVFEIDGASNNGVDDVRDLRDNIKYLPSHSRYRIIIIDEVHMLSTNAFNALLKTLEEPPEHVKFIFATTEPHKLPVTILSRCQRFDFKRVTVPKIISRLREIAGKESVDISDASLALIARKGDGSMRDSLTAFDQVLAFSGNSVSDDDVSTLLGTIDRRLLAEISAAVFGGDTQGVLAGIKQVDLVGYNMRQFCQELIEHFRNLLVIRSVKKPEEILDLAAAEFEELQKQSQHLTATDIQRRLTLLIKAESEMAYATFPRLIVEMALLKATLLAPMVPIQELIDKIKALETVAVHTPSLPWETARIPSALLKHNVEQPDLAPARPVQQAATHVLPMQAGGQSDWSRFVAFVNDQERMLGSVLEHGSPLKQDIGLIEIGFPVGSYYLTAAQDSEFIADTRKLATTFNGRDTLIRVTAIESGLADTPLSLAEKKKSDAEQRREELKKEVENNPLIKEAERVFGCSVTEVREY
ncbi:MAG: DNA polymerase III subunit gamma/tau [Desulfuromonadaceae bacterium]|nr:DNA polymerase III subunit gamma/tau [Desulfuromonadaceae bacterium]MDD5105502.1 DNA polymerase III subunit gamma/tau [Desulfuromonadaceae bacterium]